MRVDWGPKATAPAGERAGLHTSVVAGKGGVGRGRNSKLGHAMGTHAAWNMSHGSMQTGLVGAGGQGEARQG